MHTPTPLVILVSLAVSMTGLAQAAPTITPGPIVVLCDLNCVPVGGVGLAGEALGFLINDSSSGSDVATFVVVDRTTGDEVSQTVLGSSADVVVTDVTSDLNGGAWIVGFNDTAGVSTPGRWHTSDLATRDTPLSFDGNTDLLLTSVASNGTAFGVTRDDFASKVLADGTAINLAAGLSDELPTTISDSAASDAFAVGDARDGGTLTLAAWNGTTLAFQDTVTGGNGVIGPRLDGALVLVGIRIGDLGPEIGAFTDPFGSATATSVAAVTSAEFVGMDNHGFGYAYGSVEGEAAFVDTNTMEVVPLGDFAITGFASLVSMDFLGGDEWLLVLRGSTHYTLATITLGTGDEDTDGVDDSVDNCRSVANPNQIDADGDLIGNRCDADYNNDCSVNPTDLGILRLNFLGADPVVDLNGDGVVNPTDLGILRLLFLQTPGPGAPGNLCE